MNSQPVYVVDGARTPFLKSRNVPGPFSAADLATLAGRQLLARQPFAASALDEVILGCVMPALDEVNIARVVALRMGCGHAVPAWTVMRNCASGMQALDSAIANIQRGRAQLVLAGGVDALSRAPVLWSEAMVRSLSAWAAAKSWRARIAVLAGLRPAHLAPVIALLKGLTDPIVGLSMGQTAENLAWRFGITRAEMDDFALRSHQHLAAAQDAGHFAASLVPLVDAAGKIYAHDEGLRRNSSRADLARLKPFFDRKYGRVTAGNSSQISDGASWLLLASAQAVQRYGLQPLGLIRDSQWAGLAPEQMGLGPVHAATPILQRHGLALDDVDAWEINEAFAAQLIACLRAWNDADYCREALGLDDVLGELDESRLNIDGGAIALGHPVGASGARIVLQLLHILRRQPAAGRPRRGIASICIGGGQGGAMLVEAL
jgi:acetyl-CoA C-acetyltransferase